MDDVRKAFEADASRQYRSRVARTDQMLREALALTDRRRFDSLMLVYPSLSWNDGDRMDDPYVVCILGPVMETPLGRLARRLAEDEGLWSVHPDRKV